MSEKQFKKNRTTNASGKKQRNKIDEFISFVTMFNKFINHNAKKKIRIIDKDMRM